MPAVQKPKSYKQPKPRTTDDTSEAGPSRPKPRPIEQRDASGIPGVSKLKGQIRQTTRLLAKASQDNLEPGLRIQTQRRLTSLQADLAKAEKRDVEKKNGEKYHMVKFFERQKLMRIIKRAKKNLGDESLKSSKREKAQRELDHGRILLNYILHYPNEQKYIAIFPAQSASAKAEEDAEDEDKQKLVLPKIIPAEASPDMSTLDKGDRKRLELIIRVKEKMAQGSLSAEPEKEVEEGTRSQRVDLLAKEGGDGQQSTTKRKKDAKAAGGDEEDDFFEA